MTLTARHWSAALLTALVLHAGMLTFLWKPPVGGAKAVGSGGLEISLGPAGGAPGGVAVPPPPTAEAVDAIEAPTSEPVTEAQAVELTPQTEAVPDAVAVTEVKPKSAKTKIVEKPAPPVPKKPATVKAVAAEPAPQSASPSETAAPEPSTAPPAVAGAGGRAGTANATESGSSNNRSGGGRPGAAPDYYARLQAWLEQHKTYPDRARRRRQEGTALLSFILARNGHVSDVRIVQSTGYSLLDDEVTAMVSRANPLPPIPDDIPESVLKLVVPVAFNLR